MPRQNTMWRIRPVVVGVVLMLSGLVGVGVDAAEQAAAQRVKFVLDQLDSRRGVGVLVGEGAAGLAEEMARQSELTLYVHLPTESDVKATCARLDDTGLLGTRVFVGRGGPESIPLATSLSDFVLVEPEQVLAAKPHVDELTRVVRPLGKVFVGDEIQTKPYPAEADNWTHAYHGPDNNPQSTDQLARGTLQTQFLGPPWYVPFPVVTVTSAGRVFRAYGHVGFKERDWPWLNKLVAFNGYNGTILWIRPLVEGFNIHRNTMVATPDILYLGDDTSCKLIDTKTGKVKDEIVAPEGSTGPQITTGKVWKWMAIDNGVLYALVGSDEYRDKTLRGHKTSAGWPWRPMTQGYDGPNYPWGFGRTLFAMDLATRKVKWLHVEDKPVDGRATCLSDRRICFYSHPNFLAARSADDGSLLWHNDDPKFLDAIGPHDHAQIHLRGYASQPYLFGGRGMLFFAGPQRPRLVAVSAETGKMAWQFADGNMGLVLRDEGLYAMGCTGPSFVFEPTTGKILSNLTRRRGNCTRATGTCDAIFTRGQGNTGTLRLSVPDHVDKRYALMRPGCHGGVIAAGGMFYWGPWMCDCNLTLVGHICLAPAEKLPTNEPPQLETIASEETTLQPVKIRPGDWPTYRADNRRRGASPVTIPEKVRTAWEYRPRLPRDPAAPVTAGGLVFASGSDGVVRALKADDGQCVWRAYTGGPIVFPPAVADGRLLVGSGDGSVYAFEAASGKPLWKYRVGPARRKIDVHGRLTSTWPVGSGVLVHGNTVYAGAGLASFDGTHVCALDTATGKPRWQNDTSGNLGGDGRITGVSVQGHLLLHHNLLFMAGGNVVSPAIYRLKDGKCLNLMPRGWAVRAPRGRELFVVADRVVAFDRLLYGPKDYWANRFFGKHLMQADSDDAVIRTLNNRILKIEPPKDPKDNKLKALWESPLFKEPTALALGENAVVIAGITTEGKPAVTALALDDGRPLWTHPLPSKPSQWSLALDADGHIIIALQDGRYVCLTGE